MKTLITILLIVLSFDLFGQIDSRKDWPKSIQNEFDLIKGQKTDTFLIYYSYLGPWTNLPDSCKGIPSVWISWIKNKENYAKILTCDSLNVKTKNISSRPFDYMIGNLKDIKQKEQHLKYIDNLPPIPSDGLWEYVIFMTNNERIVLSLSDFQRTNELWKKSEWIKPTVEMIDIIQNEIKKNGQ
jgi:hypothetical protein